MYSWRMRMNEFYELVTELKVLAKLLGGKWNIYIPPDHSWKIKYPCLLISFTVKNRIIAYTNKTTYRLIDGDDPIDAFNQAKEFLISVSNNS